MTSTGALSFGGLLGPWLVLYGSSGMPSFGFRLPMQRCKNPSEESYSKDISKSADFFLQFSFMNLRFGETTFTCSDRSILLK